jgi:ATP-dependent DNA helicase DinG
VCFLAEVDSDRRVVRPRAVARGNHQAVLAAARDASVGEILIHNHPSGVLEPSEPDLVLAARAYTEGLGTGIVDNRASGLYVVVEPPAPRQRITLDPLEVEELLEPGGRLASRFSGYEDRPAQREMLREVVARYNDGGVALVEAGTGTGKSLAYLLPAALWALANGERTVISTNTINLQEQLVSKDLPLVNELTGGSLKWALVKGRGNYVSIRRLHLAMEGAVSLFDEDRDDELQALLDWSRTTRDGSLSDISARVSDDVWDEVRSDGDICLGVRCPHFQECFYQRARREAVGAEVLVANHALLLADVSLRRASDNWSHAAVLPPYRHLVLDEAHNVEDAATSHLGAEVTRAGLFRALGRLERNGKGVLQAVDEELGRTSSGGEVDLLRTRLAERLRPAVERARGELSSFFDLIEPFVPDSEEGPLRLGKGDASDPSTRPTVLEHLDRLVAACSRLAREVESLRAGLEDDVGLADRMQGRILDLRALERRMQEAGRGLSMVLDPPGDASSLVRWIEASPRRRGGGRNIRLAAAPVEPGPLLRESLFRKVETAVLTSATLAAGSGDFSFLRGRLGLDALPVRVESRAPDTPDLAFFEVEDSRDVDDEEELVVTETHLASPFDFEVQTRLVVPTDLPGYDAGSAFQEATARVVADLAEITDGGLFVLFTSYRALGSVARLLRESGRASRWPIFVHGEAPRSRLLDDFVGSANGILLGTASFWEGVDVPGDPLRGLVLQKLPFRVPTEPVTQARMEAMEARGMSAFQSYLLPHAALRLKQGFGRLVRSRSDRGGVVLLDSRILTKGYGRVLRRSLPPAPLLKGPWSEVSRELSDFYGTRRQ